jgi:uncharacterized membrane protein
MAQSKAGSGRGPASANGGRPGGGGGTARQGRTVAAVSATPTSRPAGKRAGPEPELTEDELLEEEPPRRNGPPLWLQLVSLVLAVVGLAISAYETWAHFNGSHLAGCTTGPGHHAINCTAVITSPQSLVFGVIPVAILGLAFYVAAVPLFSPWAWRLRWSRVHQLRLISVIVGIGFVMYLVYAELFQIGSICEYCTGVHIVTFLLFGITVFSAAIWGLNPKRDDPARD